MEDALFKIEAEVEFKKIPQPVTIDGFAAWLRTYKSEIEGETKKSAKRAAVTDSTDLSTTPALKAPKVAQTILTASKPPAPILSDKEALKKKEPKKMAILKNLAVSLKVGLKSKKWYSNGNRSCTMYD
jgi:hypothetical protein